jgi:hypothetical protein
LIEVIQNADDLHAHDVRFALRNVGGRQQLLMVHDGDPVAYAHVMAMTLPHRLEDARAHFVRAFGAFSPLSFHRTASFTFDMRARTRLG